MKKNIYDWIIVGAGVSGSYLAYCLARKGERVALIEKSRGVGGRLCVRKLDQAYFLHGAQFFTIKHACFQSEIQRFIDAGDIVPWPGEIAYINAQGEINSANDTVRYSIYPHTNRFCKEWTRTADVFLQQKVVRLEKTDVWNIYTQDERVFYTKNLVLSPPLPQVQQLIPQSMQQEYALDLHSEWKKAATLMISFSSDNFILPKRYSASFVNPSSLDFISSQESRLGLNGRQHWAFVLAHNWVENHWQCSSNTMLSEVDQTLLSLGLGGLKECTSQSVQFWRYATPLQSKNIPQWYPRLRLGLIGEIFQGGRVEGAFLSSVALMKELAHKS